MYAGAPNAMHSSMKTHRTALSLLTVAAMTAMSLATGGCSMFHHHQPKSSWKIVDEGDKSPFITNTPEVNETSTRKVEVETGPVQPQ